jgi:hypothetical protein
MRDLDAAGRSVSAADLRAEYDRALAMARQQVAQEPPRA